MRPMSGVPTRALHDKLMAGLAASPRKDAARFLPAGSALDVDSFERRVLGAERRMVRAGMTPINYLAAAAFLPAATILGFPAVLTGLNEVRQRSVLALLRRSLVKLAAESPAPAEALD